MPEAPRFRIGFPSLRRPADSPGVGGTDFRPELPQMPLEPMPATRPHMGGLERATLEEIVGRVLMPSFLRNEWVDPIDFVSTLRRGADLLRRNDRDEALRLAATTVDEALEDRDLLEACRLFLLKG